MYQNIHNIATVGVFYTDNHVKEVAFDVFYIESGLPKVGSHVKEVGSCVLQMVGYLLKVDSHLPNMATGLYNMGYGLKNISNNLLKIKADVLNYLYTAKHTGGGIFYTNSQVRYCAKGDWQKGLYSAKLT